MLEHKNIHIYNPKQAYFYIQQGLIPEDVWENNTTGSICFVFDKDKSNPLYTKWLNREGKLKRI